MITTTLVLLFSLFSAFGLGSGTLIHVNSATCVDGSIPPLCG